MPEGGWRTGDRRRHAHAVRAPELHRGVTESILQPDRLARRVAAALVVADQRRRLARREGTVDAGRVAEAERSYEHRVVRSPAMRECETGVGRTSAGLTDVAREARQPARRLRRPAAHAQDAGITLGAGVAVVARRSRRAWAHSGSHGTGRRPPRRGTSPPGGTRPGRWRTRPRCSARSGCRRCCRSRGCRRAPGCRRTSLRLHRVPTVHGSKSSQAAPSGSGVGTQS